MIYFVLFIENWDLGSQRPVIVEEVFNVTEHNNVRFHVVGSWSITHFKPVRKVLIASNV